MDAVIDQVCGTDFTTSTSDNKDTTQENDPDMTDKTVIDVFLDNVEKRGDERFITQPMGGGEANNKYWTFNETLAEAQLMAGYIESLNLSPKSQIAICSKNCAWWVIADLAIWMSGHVSVPIYPTLTEETTKYCLEHSESKLCFVGKLDDAPWKTMKGGFPADLNTISFPLCPDNAAQKTWDECMKEASPIKTMVKRTLEEMATIIYTSGSTGEPKGVMTSFKAMVDTTKGLLKVIRVTVKDRYLSYLPMAHGMERWCGECVPLYSGIQLFFAESLATFVDDLNRARPTVFVSVPRLWTKFQSGVFTKMPEKKLKTLLSIPIINWMVRRKILKGLGLDQVRFAGSGSAPIPKQLLEWYHKLGLDILEGYGMTENFNYSHMSMPGKQRVGYVGNVYSDVEQRIAEDGEIQVKGPGNMMGYFKNEEATKETITEDGWIRTGDKGELDETGRLKITGRTKEIFKTSKGKYVAPAPIESEFIANHLVEMACVSGRAQPQPHAIIQLTEGHKKEAAKGEAERENLGKELEALLAAVNPKLDGHEHLDFLVIVKEDWLPENGFLTPTQKIKRSTIEGTYETRVEEWYSEKKKVIWFGW
jgi:long-chain acyl-CoA synthetase